MENIDNIEIVGRFCRPCNKSHNISEFYVKDKKRKLASGDIVIDKDYTWRK